MKRKIVFIFLLIIDLYVMYLTIKGRTHVLRVGSEFSIINFILKYIAFISPYLVHEIPGGKHDDIKESLKYMRPLLLILIAILIIDEYSTY